MHYDKTTFLNENHVLTTLYVLVFIQKNMNKWSFFMEFFRIFGTEWYQNNSVPEISLHEEIAREKLHLSTYNSNR